MAPWPFSCGNAVGLFSKLDEKARVEEEEIQEEIQEEVVVGSFSTPVWSIHRSVGLVVPGSLSLHTEHQLGKYKSVKAIMRVKRKYSHPHMAHEGTGGRGSGSGGGSSTIFLRGRCWIVLRAGPEYSSFGRSCCPGEFSLTY